MSSVTYPAYAGGATFTDDADPLTGMGRGGHRERLLPMLAAAVAVAAHTDDTAERVDVVAAGVVSAPGTQASSATSLSVGTGSKTLVVEAGKAFVVGMPVRLTASASAYMDGTVTAYSAGTGSMTVSVTGTAGSGTFAAWTVILTGRQALPGVAGEEGKQLIVQGGTAVWASPPPAEALAGVSLQDLSAADAALPTSALTTQRITACGADWRSLRLPAASTLPAGLEYQIINDTLQAVALRAAGGRRIGTVPPLSQAAVRLLDPAAPVWSVPGQTLHPCAELVVTPGAAAAVRVAPLDSTHALCAWLSGTTIRVVVATIAAGVVTLGGAATIVTGATSVQDIDLAGLSATDGAIVWAETISGPAYRVRCAALTVSGTTATAGTPITIGSLTGSGTTRVAALDTGRVVVVRGCVTPAQTVLTTVGISAGTASAYSDSADLAISSVSGLTLTGIDTARALLTAGTTARVVTCSGTAAPTAGSAASGAGAPGSAAFDGVSGVLLGYPGAAPTALRADVSGTTVTLSAAGYLPVTAAAGTLALLARLAAGDVAVLATPAVADHSQAARIRAASGAPDAVARADIGRITSGASNGTALCALSSGLLLLAAVRPGDSYPVLTPIEVTP